MLFSSFKCNVLRANFGARRKAGEFERLVVCARNSLGTLHVQSSRSLRSFASISPAVAEYSEEYSEGTDAAAR